MRFLAYFLLITCYTYAQNTTSTVVNNNNVIAAQNILDWNNAGIWSNGVPQAGDTVIITLPVQIDASIEVADLIVNVPPSADWVFTLFGIPLFTIPVSIPDGLFVSGNSEVKVTNRIYLEDGDININANGNFIIVGDQNNYGRIASVANGSSINGPFTYQKWVDRCNKWSLYGGPFDATLNDYSDSTNGRMIYTGIPGGDWPNFGWVNTYFFDEDWATAGYDGYTVPPNCNSPLQRGNGFWHWNSDTTYNSASNNPIPQNWKVSTKGNIDFTVPFDFPVDFTNNNVTASDGWNLLANPYPGTIDWDASGWTRSGTDGALYEYNTCTQTYATYVGGVGTNGGDRYIAPFQGFYVKTNASSPQLTSTASVIVEEAHLLKSALTNIVRIYFNSDEMVVRLNNQASNQFDNQLDAYKYLTENSEIYSKNSSGPNNYSIQAIKDSANVIPIYTKGNGTLFFSDLETWSSEYNIYLKDLEYGVIYPVDENFTFPFTVNDTTQFINRFQLIFDNLHTIEPQVDNTSSIDVNENEFVKITTMEKHILLQSSKNENVTIELYNTLGQLIYSKNCMVSREGITLDRPQQISILKVFNENGSCSKKVF